MLREFYLLQGWDGDNWAICPDSIMVVEEYGSMLSVYMRGWDDHIEVEPTAEFLAVLKERGLI